jgi:hypothetical protein
MSYHRSVVSDCDCTTALGAFFLPYWRVGQHLIEACRGDSSDDNSPRGDRAQSAAQRTAAAAAAAAKCCSKVVCTVGGFLCGVGAAIPSCKATYEKITADTNKLGDATTPGYQATGGSTESRIEGGFTAAIVAFYLPGWGALAGAEFSDCLTACAGELGSCIKKSAISGYQKTSRCMKKAFCCCRRGKDANPPALPAGRAVAEIKLDQPAI